MKTIYGYFSSSQLLGGISRFTGIMVYDRDVYVSNGRALEVSHYTAKYLHQDLYSRLFKKTLERLWTVSVYPAGTCYQVEIT
jgi:hypothetical protein